MDDRKTVILGWVSVADKRDIVDRVYSDELLTVRLAKDLKAEQEKTIIESAKVAVLVERINNEIEFVKQFESGFPPNSHVGRALKSFYNITQNLPKSAQALLDERDSYKKATSDLIKITNGISFLLGEDSLIVGDDIANSLIPKIFAKLKELKLKDEAIERHKGVLRDIKFVTTQKQVDEIATKALKGE